jgi:peptidoglycan biosynthesis protein MviN/MurJ (putative lipid II flippase)
MHHVRSTWTRAILLAGLPAAAVTALFSESIVSVIFQGGAFSTSDARLVALVQAALLFQVPFYVLTQFQSRCLIAMGQYAIQVQAGAYLLAFTVLWGALLSHFFDAPGLGLAVTAAFASVAAWYHRILGPAQVERSTPRDG